MKNLNKKNGFNLKVKTKLFAVNMKMVVAFVLATLVIGFMCVLLVFAQEVTE